MTNERTSFKWAVLIRIVVKAAVLFGAINLLFALTMPLSFLGQLSLYNRLVPGRERLPYGESPAAYNLSLDNLDAMFASHVISQPKPADEYRIVVIGDSSVWGILLRPDETLTGYLNATPPPSPLPVNREGGQTTRFYNLGHPVLSVTKDLMLLDMAMAYQPDTVIWLVTLQSLAWDKQLEAPLVQHNAPRIHDLIQRYNLSLDVNNPLLTEPDFWSRTLVGQRRVLADLWRLQLYGISWATTGIDQVYGEYTPRRNDFDPDESWQTLDAPITLTESDLAFEVLLAGQKLVGDVPLLIVNEPIYIADGENSDLRYNLWYPRWVYDAYRGLMTEIAAKNDWHYLDLWDSIAPVEFTDSPVHLTPAGSRQLSDMVREQINTNG